MSKKQINISQQVMDQIHDKNIHMKPRVYFILGSILLFFSIVTAIIGSVFLFSLTRFALRSHGPMGQYRLESLLSSFPWWAPLLALAGIAAGIWLLKKYEFSYRHNFRIISIGIIIAVIVAVMAIEYFHLDDIWFKRGPMRGIMRQYIEKQENVRPGFRNRFNQEYRSDSENHMIKIQTQSTDYYEFRN